MCVANVDRRRGSDHRSLNSKCDPHQFRGAAACDVFDIEEVVTDFELVITRVCERLCLQFNPVFSYFVYVLLLQNSILSMPNDLVSR